VYGRRNRQSKIRCLRLILLVHHVGKIALTAVVAVEVGSHEDTTSAGLTRALLPEAGDLVVLVNLVELEGGHLFLTGLPLGLLGLGVLLLLALLTTTTKAEHEVKGRLLLDVVVAKGAAILELLASKDKTLLIRGDALLVLDLLLYILDGVRGLDIKSDGL